MNHESFTLNHSSEPLGRAALDGDGAGNRGDDSGEELDDFNDCCPFNFHNEYNNKGYQIISLQSYLIEN
jgi:hypothetical protein